MKGTFLFGVIILFSLLEICPWHPLYAQSEGESSLMSYGGGRSGAGSCLFRDYQAMGINPANLGIYEGDVIEVTTGALDGSGLFYSNALPKSDIIHSLLSGKNLSAEDKKNIAQQFLEGGNSFSAEAMPLGIVVQFPKVGGLGFSWRERMTGGATFSHPLADIVFNGINSVYIDTIIYDILGQAIGILDSTYNAADLFNGSSLQYNWLREYNISFGRKIVGNKNFTIYAGAAVKFMQSNAIADISFNADTISGFAAFSKLFNIDYANFTNPDFELEGRFTPVGKGMGVDIGTTVSIKNKFFAAVSVSDIGSIKYTGNLVTINDAIVDSLIGFIGINEADIFNDLTTLFNANGLFQYLPEGERKVSLPTLLRAGVGWHVSNKLDAGFDLLRPVNKVPGSVQKMEYAALLNFVPVKAFRISTGFTAGGIGGFTIPLGLSFSFIPEQIWQISIGTGDIISWVRQDKPTISLNFSLLRFHYE